MIRSGLVCKQEHFNLMDCEVFDNLYSSLVIENDLYDHVSVIFVSLEDGVGDYCELRDRTLHLLLHVEPSTESMIETFERNFFEPVEETT